MCRNILTFEYVSLNQLLGGRPHRQAANEPRANRLPRLLSLVLALHHQDVPVHDKDSTMLVLLNDVEFLLWWA